MRIYAMVAATALCLSTAATVVVAPAAHGDDVLTTITKTSPEGVCPLRRVDRHLVRCDDLTGAGVPAPTWIPEL